MSRTYRTVIECECYAWGRFWTYEQEKETFGDDWWKITYGWKPAYRENRVARDKKNWSKPDKLFKRMKRQGERAKVRDALHHDREIPIFPKSDQFDWT
jgi:hypothetical protein